MPSATWRTRTACGFSYVASPAAGANDCPVGGLGIDTWIPDAPTTMRIPGRTSDMGTVRTRMVPSAASASTRPQSISGFSTSYHWPSTRTRVWRLVVE